MHHGHQEHGCGAGNGHQEHGCGAPSSEVQTKPETAEGGSGVFTLCPVGSVGLIQALLLGCILGPSDAAAPVPNPHQPPYGDPHGGGGRCSAGTPPRVLWVRWRLCAAVKQRDFLCWEICAIAEGPQSAAAELCRRGGGLGGVVMRIEVVLWLFGAHNVVWVEGKRAQALPLLRGEGAVGCGRC